MFRKGILVLVVLFGWAGAADAAPVLQLQKGLIYEYNSRDGAGSTWHRTLEVLDQETVAGITYFRIAERDNNPKANDTYKEYLVRSTETLIYVRGAFTFNKEVLLFKAEPPGDYWSFAAMQGGESGTQYNQVLSIESVTVPYATFPTAYKNGHQFEDYPRWYDWIVPSNGAFPGGIVKTRDDWGVASNNGLVEHVLAKVTKPQISLNTALDNNALTFATSGDAAWVVDDTVFYSGGSAARSGAIGNNQKSKLQTTVSGPGTLSFYWKVSSEADADSLVLYLDQDYHTWISGEQGWQLQAIAIPPGSHTVSWIYLKNDSGSAGADCGWVDQVVFTQGGIPLNTALDNNNMVFTSAGNAIWFGVSDAAGYGGNAARSGAVGDNQESWVESLVVGPGKLSFRWKVSSQEAKDFLAVLVDSNPKYWLSGELGWYTESIRIPAGYHFITWIYFKDASLKSGSDCGWLDRVIYTPGGAVPPLQLLLE